VYPSQWLQERLSKSNGDKDGDGDEGTMKMGECEDEMMME
jgi:hypothetical protein